MQSPKQATNKQKTDENFLCHRDVLSRRLDIARDDASPYIAELADEFHVCLMPKSATEAVSGLRAIPSLGRIGISVADRKCG
jgi:hypothetical protein